MHDLLSSLTEDSSNMYPVKYDQLPCLTSEQGMLVRCFSALFNISLEFGCSAYELTPTHVAKRALFLCMVIPFFSANADIMPFGDGEGMKPPSKAAGEPFKICSGFPVGRKLDPAPN